MLRNIQKFFQSYLIRSQAQTAFSSEVDADGWMEGMDCEQFVNADLWFLGEDDSSNDPAVMDLEVYISDQETEPTWSSAVSATNLYAKISLWDLQTGVLLASTGDIEFTDNGVKLYMVNTNGARWINIKVKNYTSGVVSAFLKPYTQH